MLTSIFTLENSDFAMFLITEGLFVKSGWFIITIGWSILIHDFDDYKYINYWWTNYLFLSEYNLLRMSTHIISYPIVPISACPITNENYFIKE